MKIGMGFDQPHRLTAIRGLQHSRVVRQFLENATQRVANQGVIVDQKNLHPGCLFGWSRQEYFKPCQKSSVRPCFNATAVRGTSKREEAALGPDCVNTHRCYDSLAESRGN